MADNAWKGIEMDVRVPMGARTLEAAIATGASAIAILGPSGCGKTTLIRTLAGVERRATGRLAVDGEAWLAADGRSVPPWERGVGWAPQEATLFPHLSVRENMAFGGAGAAEVEEIAELFRITDLLERRPRNLSGGERQRVTVSRALLTRPRLVLLDEPFSALDRPLRADLSRTVKALLERRGVPLVLVSHDEEDADILADERWHIVDAKVTGG